MKAKWKPLFNLKVKRMERGLTQEELGKRIGVAKITVFQWEKGWRRPSKEMLEKVASVLECEVKDIDSEVA